MTSSYVLHGHWTKHLCSIDDNSEGSVLRVATAYVSQQSLDDQLHEKEAELWILIVQVIDHLVGHRIEFAVGLTDHGHGAYLLS